MLSLVRTSCPKSFPIGMRSISTESKRKVHPREYALYGLGVSVLVNLTYQAYSQEKNSHDLYRDR